MNMKLEGMVDITFKQKHTFVAIMAALQKRIGETVAPSLIIQRIIHLFVKVTH